jgi:hypothetical protein
LKKLLLILLLLQFVPMGLANLKLASTPVGFVAGTWLTAFGFELTNLSITAGDDHTQIFSQIPANISIPQYSTYQADPTESFTPVAIATKGNMTNGTILVSYTIYMTLSRVGWMGSVVSATNVPLTIQNGQLQSNSIVSTNGNTSCEVDPIYYNQQQYIELYCWLSAPP